MYLHDNWCCSTSFVLFIRSFVQILMIRESQIRKIHYATAMGSVGLVALHILVRFSTGNFAESLTYENVIANYQNLTYAVLLELMLILISIHGFNGLRGILLDYKSGLRYDKLVNWGCFLSAMGLIAFGTTVIILANQIEI